MREIVFSLEARQNFLRNFRDGSQSVSQNYLTIMRKISYYKSATKKKQAIFWRHEFSCFYTSFALTAKVERAAVRRSRRASSVARFYDSHANLTGEPPALRSITAKLVFLFYFLIRHRICFQAGKQHILMEGTNY